MNSAKTNIIRFYTPQNKDVFDPYLIHNDEKIVVSDTSDFLGLKIDKHLNWKPHCEKLLKKLNSCVFQMLVIRDKVDLKTRITVYYALFYSFLQYGIEFWGKSIFCNDVFKVQKRFVRTMLYKHRQTSCKPFFKELQLMTVPSIYIYLSASCL